MSSFEQNAVLCNLMAELPVWLSGLLKGFCRESPYSVGETFEFSLNYQQYRVGISMNHFFPFVSFVTFVIVTHKFGGKCYLVS